MAIARPAAERWKEWFRAPTTSASPARGNPQRGLAVSNRSGVSQLYAWDVPSGELRQLTQHPQGKASGTIDPLGRFVYYLEDADGNEIGHFVRVPWEGGEVEDLTPDLTPYSSITGLRTSRAGNILGAVVAEQGIFRLIAVEVRPDGTLGEPWTVMSSDKLMFGPSLSHDGSVAVMATNERSASLQYSLIAIDVATGERIAELWDGPDTSVELGPFAPVAGDLRIAATTNAGGSTRPLIWNPRTGERTAPDLTGVEGDVDIYDWSPEATHLLLCEYRGAVQRLYAYRIDSRDLRRLDHPGGTFFGAFWLSGDEIWTQWTDSTHPPHLIALDSQTGGQKRVVLPPSEVPPCRPWRSVTFPSTDGTPIQGWLAVPEGVGPFPVILETHGGPEWAMPELFHAASQAWLDRGYAFMTINYRGSTTFGRDFAESIHGNPGELEVEDMVAARTWLIEQGIAQPDAIFLTGWSYGGYLTLQALGLYPDHWVGGMAGIAIADWSVQYEDTAPMLRGYQEALLGGTPETKSEQYRKSSPISYVDRVQAPVLIIQGRNDTRTPARPVEMYERRLRELGKPVEVHWFEAGHGSHVVDQQIEHQGLMMRWADRVLDPET